MNNGRYVDIENDVLRDRLRDVKGSAAELVDAVERYLKQRCLRSELYTAKENLKKQLK